MALMLLVCKPLEHLRLCCASLQKQRTMNNGASNANCARQLKKNSTSKELKCLSHTKCLSNKIAQTPNRLGTPKVQIFASLEFFYLVMEVLGDDLFFIEVDTFGPAV